MARAAHTNPVDSVQAEYIHDREIRYGTKGGRERTCNAVAILII
jgi:hypothetical protein